MMWECFYELRGDLSREYLLYKGPHVWQIWVSPVQNDDFLYTYRTYSLLCVALRPGMLHLCRFPSVCTHVKL